MESSYVFPKFFSGLFNMLEQESRVCILAFLLMTSSDAVKQRVNMQR